MVPPRDEIVVESHTVYVKASLKDWRSMEYQRLSEKERIESLKDFLKKDGVLPKGVHCRVFSEQEDNSVPFTGGGDLLLTCDTSSDSFIVMTQNLSEDEDEECSPRY